MSEQDPLGLWYSLLEREHGEYMGIRFGRAPLSGGAVEWRNLPHSQYDGVAHRGLKAPRARKRPQKPIQHPFYNTDTDGPKILLDPMGSKKFVLPSPRT